MIPALLQQTGLSLDRLNSFSLVASVGSITKAAKGDPARQSLYSRQVKELEEFFGTELIRRKGRGVALTATGQRLHTIVREIFASLSDFKHESTQESVEIVVGAGDSLIQWLLMPNLNRIYARLPNVHFKFLNLPTSESVKRLSDGIIDFAIVRSGAVTRPLKSAHLGSLTYSVFLPKDAKFTGHQKEINELRLATLEGTGSFRRDLNAATAKQKIALNIQVECSTFTLAANAVTQGGMAAILPRIAEAQLLASGAKRVDMPFLKALSRDISIAWNPRLIRIRPVLQKTFDVLQSHCAF